MTAPKSPIEEQTKQDETNSGEPQTGEKPSQGLSNSEQNDIQSTEFSNAENEDTNAILVRRRRFVAAALTGVALGGYACDPTPMPCLSPPPQSTVVPDGGAAPENTAAPVDNKPAVSASASGSVGPSAKPPVTVSAPVTPTVPRVCLKVKRPDNQ